MTKKTREEIIEKSQRVLNMISQDIFTKKEKDEITREVVSNFMNHVNPGFLDFRKTVSNDFAAIDWTATETTVIDIYGKEYIDCLGGYGIFNCGRRNEKVMKAVIDQMIKKQALHSWDLLDPLRSYLAELMADITPGDLQYSFFTNSGTESVEGALKLSRFNSRRPGVISTTKAFHGKSLGSLSATAKAEYRKYFMPLVPGFRHVFFGDFDMMKKEVEASFFVGDEIGAVILEPIQGVGGINIPPDDYFPKVRKLCDDYGMHLIVDEVQTGMGRTGKIFAIDHSDVVPDIICTAKSLGGGILPIGAFTANEKLWQVMLPNPAVHTTTFGGNPLSCAAAIAYINVMMEDDLPGQAAAKGDYLLPKLKALMAEHPNIAVEARGRGLLIGLEFTTDEIGFAIAKGLFDNGVLVGGTTFSAKTIRIEPSLIISYEQMDTLLAVLAKVLKDIEANC